ncbi:MAG TPA: radical SAM protein [Acidimicrobiales bacterium]|nr:radical SAM protein [Acidimicrobiales bacterium]
MRVVLVSTYELGHQPVHLAVPAGELRRRGHDVVCVDLAVDDWSPSVLDGADRLGVSVPMHTATRLANDLLRTVPSTLPTCAYGLYAGVGSLAQRRIAGEYLDELVAWVEEGGDGTTVSLRRNAIGLPARDLLPGLDRYARVALAPDDMRLVGALEASRGCAAQCRHCPVPTVYGGRTRNPSVDEVVADVAQLVALGARHLTFADPDFLSGPHHARRVVDAVHATFPSLTFDITTKVELILRHAEVWPTFADAGLLFVTSAVECVDDRVLQLLDKGHTAADASAAVRLLRSHGIELRPSLLPFTPWTTRRSLLDLIEFVVAHDLAGNVDPVHWSIRLLLPDGSLLLQVPEMQEHLTGYDPAMLGHQWRSADPAMDALHASVAAVVEAGGDLADVCRIVGAPAPPSTLTPADERPHLTESWFCCAEPTTAQRSVLSAS